MYKLLLLAFALNSYAITFEWQSTQESHSYENPMKEISQKIEKEINIYIEQNTLEPLDITQAIPPHILKPELPPRVKEPVLPSPIKLTKGEFEKTSAFEFRVQKASSERDFELNKLQENYRAAVEKRNRQIEFLSKEYNENIAKRNQIVKNIQLIQQADNKRVEFSRKKQKEIALSKLNVFAKEAIAQVYGKAKVSYKSYDADAEVIYLHITSADGKNFTKDVELKVAPQNAKLLKQNVALLVPKVVFDIAKNENNAIELSIHSINVAFNDKVYVAQDVTSSYKAKPISITIENKTKKFDIEEHKTELLALQESYEFQLQNPNLNDKIVLGSVAYNENGAIVGANELVNEANALPKIKTDKTKWLFMIAIENYAETDNVLYTTRSAKAIEKSMQKRLGIDEKHTFSLLNDKATSGAIKDKLHSLAAKVKADDSIYFYYSGHGVPGTNGDAFILPEDKIVDFIDKDPFFKLENIYKKLSLTKAKHSFVFIDACFSGRTDNELIFKGVAPGLLKTKKVPYDKKKLTIITAGTDKEFSNMYEEKRYRLFSYYLAKGFLNNERDVSVLYKRLNANVVEKSEEKGERYKQTPQIYGNQKVRLF